MLPGSHLDDISSPWSLSFQVVLHEKKSLKRNLRKVMKRIVANAAKLRLILGICSVVGWR